VSRPIQCRKKTIWKAGKGGKHGGQAGVPQPEQNSSSAQGIVRDEKGQEQPADKPRAQHVSRKDEGGDPPGGPSASLPTTRNEAQTLT
jgi:hypothetical protein